MSSCAELICGFSQVHNDSKISHLTGDSALQEDRRVLVDEMQPLEHFNPALVIGQQLEVLVG
jgi:hypothetical protein